MSTTTVLAHERRALLAAPAILFILGLTFVISLYALYRGAVQRAASVASIQAFVEDSETKATKARESLVKVEKGSADAKKYPWAGLAMNIAPTATAQPGPLADFAVGVSDIQPTATHVSQWRTIDRLFSNYEFESPLAIAAGPFDFTFVVIFLLPLLMIVLSYDALAGDRESGRLGILMSNPVSLRNLVLAKLRVRMTAVFLLFAVCAVAGLLLGASDLSFDLRLSRFVIWLAIATLYLGWWAFLLSWIVSLNKRSETTLLAMVAVWAFSSLVGPAVLAAAAESFYPAPSRLGYLSKVRSAANEAYRSRQALTKGLALEHPELSVDDYTLPEYIRTAFVVTQTVDRKVQPVIDDFDTTHAARLRFLRGIQFVSPAVAALQAFNEAAGTSLERQNRFEKEAREFKAALASRLGAQVLAGKRLTVEQLDHMPAFTFVEAPVSVVLRRVAFPIVLLLVLSVLFRQLAHRNLERLQTRVRER